MQSGVCVYQSMSSRRSCSPSLQQGEIWTKTFRCFWSDPVELAVADRARPIADTDALYEPTEVAAALAVSKRKKITYGAQNRLLLVAASINQTFPQQTKLAAIVQHQGPATTNDLSPRRAIANCEECILSGMRIRLNLFTDGIFACAVLVLYDSVGQRQLVCLARALLGKTWCRTRRRLLCKLS